jgi:cbb3-type cytochrome oxidase cytochrome c subunit
MHGVIAPAALTAVTHLCAIATVAAASGTKPPNFLILFGDDWYARNPCRNAYSNILRILQWITWLIAQGLRGHGRKLGG